MEPLGNGGAGSQTMDMEVDDSGGKTYLNSASTSQTNRVTKIFTIAKNSDGSNMMQGPLNNVNSTQIVMAPSGSQYDAHSNSSAQTVTVSRNHILNSSGQTNIVSISPQKFVPRTPPRQIVSARVSMSPGKSPSKFTMIPVSGMRSPQKLQPGQIVTVSHGGITSVSQTFVNSSKPLTVTSSPNKVIVQRQLPPGTIQVRSSTAGTVNSIQPQTIQGNRLQYLRFVTAGGPSNAAAGIRQIVPANAKSLLAPQPSPSTQHMRIQPAIQPMQQQIVKSVSTSQNQRVILPATSQVRVSMASIAPRPAVGMQASGGLSLPPGATLIQQGAMHGQPNMPGFALVQGQFVQQQMGVPSHHTNITSQSVIQNKQPVDSMGNAASAARQQARQMPSNGPTDSGTQRPRKPCNCTKSQCLKLYCDCFANGEFCSNCNCNNCFNNLEHEEERGKSIKQCLDRNPLAFKPKIGKGKNGEATDRRHNKGCNCKRSGCLKNYCECYEAKIMCSSLCKCVGCKNFEESPDRKSGLNILSSSHHDRGDSSHNSTTKAHTRLSAAAQILSQPSRPAVVPTGQRLPYSFVTEDVALATCMCLVAQAEEAERTQLSEVAQERTILVEFGRCIMQVIESANKTRNAADTDSIHSSS